MSAVRALVFDFNGTLSQDEPILCAIYRDLFSEHGRPLSVDDYYGLLAGLSEEAIISGWLGVEGRELGALIEERIDRYRRATADGATVPEHVRAAVRFAAGRVPIGLVSGAFRVEVEPVLEGAGIAPLFTAAVTADDVEHGKPHPEGYLRALERLGGLPAPDVVALEDTQAGVASAKAAGLSVLGVLGTLAPDRLAQADELVERVDVALIERLLT